MDLTKLLNNSQDQLGNIVAKVKLHHSLQSLLKKYVDPELANNLQVANYRQGCLVIQFTNAALATRFRYQIPQLLKQLRLEKQLPGLASINCLVRPKSFEPEPKKNKLTLSKSGAAALKEAAGYIDDPDLAKALEKLGANGDKGNFG